MTLPGRPRPPWPINWQTKGGHCAAIAACSPCGINTRPSPGAHPQHFRRDADHRHYGQRHSGITGVSTGSMAVYHILYYYIWKRQGSIAAPLRGANSRPSHHRRGNCGSFHRTHRAGTRRRGFLSPEWVIARSHAHWFAMTGNFRFAMTGVFDALYLCLWKSLVKSEIFHKGNRCGYFYDCRKSGKFHEGCRFDLCKSRFFTGFYFRCGKLLWKKLWRMWKTIAFQQVFGLFSLFHRCGKMVATVFIKQVTNRLQRSYVTAIRKDLPLEIWGKCSFFRKKCCQNMVPPPATA